MVPMKITHNNKQFWRCGVYLLCPPVRPKRWGTNRMFDRHQPHVGASQVLGKTEIKKNLQSVCILLACWNKTKKLNSKLSLSLFLRDTSLQLTLLQFSSRLETDPAGLVTDVNRTSVEKGFNDPRDFNEQNTLDFAFSNDYIEPLSSPTFVKICYSFEYNTFVIQINVGP